MKERADGWHIWGWEGVFVPRYDTNEEWRMQNEDVGIEQE
jgi:hypothetical protein